MIVYGTNSKNLGIRRVPGVKSPYDETKDLELIGEVNYFHIFWIPLFPYSKKVYPYCPGTDREINQHDLSQKAKDRIKEEKRNFRMPPQMFAGFAVIALLISYAFYANYERNQEIDGNLADIQPSDVVVFKNEDRTYSYAKVISVSADTLFFQFSNYVLEGGTPEKDLYLKDEKKYDDFFAEEIYFYQQYQIDSLRKEGDIYDLYRLE